MMKFILTTSLLVSGSLTIWAKTVSGVVVSETDSLAVVGAHCIIRADQNLVSSSFTSENGSFELPCDVKSQVVLEVSSSGYAKSEVLINPKSNGKLGVIYLRNASTMLQEVEVTGSSILYSKGNMVVFPCEADVKASPTCLSLFQKLPLDGLAANPVNRSISVDGGNPKILINGIPATMTDVNALKPGDIYKLEYSRITPARYADEGSKGYLNIILKKRNDGGQVYLYGRSAVATAFVDASLQASYHQGPSEFTIDYAPSWRNYQKVYDFTTEQYVAPDFRVDLKSEDRNPFNYLSNQIRVQYQYCPDESLSFSANFRVTPFTNHRRVYGTGEDSLNGDYEINNNSRSNDLTPSLDLFFRKDFNRNNSIEAQIVGTLGHSEYFRENTYNYTSGHDDDYVMDVAGNRLSLISAVNYVHQFNDNISLIGGYQNTASTNSNTYAETGYKASLTENNNYFYAKYGHQIKKVYISLSSGAKMYWIKNDVNRRNYIRNLTTAIVTWNIAKAWSISGAFQYSPGIPSLSSLTDYQQQLTPYLISNGNPDLKVSNQFTYQLSPSFRYRKFYTSLSIMYVDVRNFVMNDVRYIGDKMFLSQSINAKKSTNLEGMLNLSLSDVGGFGANVTLKLNRYYNEGDGWSDDLTSFSGSFSLWWNKGPFTISYWRKIPGKYLYGHSVSKDENGDALSFSYRPDKHWTLSAMWMYMFDSKGTRYPSWNYSTVNPSYTNRYIRHNGNMVCLSVTYTADFGSIFRSVRRTLNNYDTGSSILKL